MGVKKALNMKKRKKKTLGERTRSCKLMLDFLQCYETTTSLHSGSVSGCLWFVENSTVGADWVFFFFSFMWKTDPVKIANAADYYPNYISDKLLFLCKQAGWWLKHLRERECVCFFFLQVRDDWQDHVRLLWQHFIWHGGTNNDTSIRKCKKQAVMSGLCRKQTGFMSCYLHCKHCTPYGLDTYVCVKYVPVMFVKYSLRWALTTDTNISPPLLSEERHVETLHLHSEHEAELRFLCSLWHLIPHNVSEVGKTQSRPKHNNTKKQATATLSGI